METSNKVHSRTMKNFRWKRFAPGSRIKKEKEEKGGGGEEVKKETLPL